MNSFFFSIDQERKGIFSLSACVVVVMTPFLSRLVIVTCCCCFLYIYYILYIYFYSWVVVMFINFIVVWLGVWPRTSFCFFFFFLLLLVLFCGLSSAGWLGGGEGGLGIDVSSLEEVAEEQKERKVDAIAKRSTNPVDLVTPRGNSDDCNTTNHLQNLLRTTNTHTERERERERECWK